MQGHALDAPGARGVAAGEAQDTFTRAADAGTLRPLTAATVVKRAHAARSHANFTGQAAEAGTTLFEPPCPP